jgi:hypothetical protein
VTSPTHNPISLTGFSSKRRFLLIALVAILLSDWFLRRDLDFLAIEDVLDRFPQSLDRAVVAGRHPGLHTDHEPKLSFAVLINRVAKFLNEDVSEPLHLATGFTLDTKRHRRLPFPGPLQDGLCPLGVGSDDVLERCDLRLLALYDSPTQ